MMTIAMSASARRVRLSIQLVSALGNRVISARTERVAARDAARRQPATANRSVLLERLDGVGGTAWIITARGWEQRAQRHLISADEQHEHHTHMSQALVSSERREPRVACAWVV